MRIIGGSARGRSLLTPVGQDIRPTSDKVRLAMFNALYSRGGVVDHVILDAFCGTGALGCEALSQGAAQAVFFDLSKQSLQLAKQNVAALGFQDRAEFLIKDATKSGQRPAQTPAADIIFLDPPYRKNLVALALPSLVAGDWIAKGALLVIENEADQEPVTGFGELVFDKTYGETRVTFIRAD